MCCAEQVLHYIKCRGRCVWNSATHTQHRHNQTIFQYVGIILYKYIYRTGYPPTIAVCVFGFSTELYYIMHKGIYSKFEQIFKTPAFLNILLISIIFLVVHKIHVGTCRMRTQIHAK